jgi:4-hydroxyphenylpyruvate dioxygenase-like putative hemolysin
MIKNFPAEKNGFGIEFYFNEQTSKWTEEHYLIFKGEPKKVSESKFWETTCGKISISLNKALASIRKLNIRKYIKSHNLEYMDLIAFHENNIFKIVLNSDDGNLKLEFDGNKFMTKNQQ